MPRRNYPKSFLHAPKRVLSSAVLEASEKIETRGGKSYLVRVTHEGSSLYKCLGCNSDIPSGKSSVTVIEQDHIFGKQAAIDERRHWHESCWRGFRG